MSLLPTNVLLKWLPPYDAVGVTAFKVYRDGSLLATLGNVSEYTDTSVAAATSYVYYITALDAALNESGNSNKIIVTTRTASAALNPRGRVEVDFGTTPVGEATFTVIDSSVTAGSHIIAQVAWEAPTSKDLDEMEMDDILLRCAPDAGQFTIFARATDRSYLHDKFKINYVVF